MKTTLCIFITLLTTSFAGYIGSETTGYANNGYTYSLGHSGDVKGVGRHTDISSFDVGSAAINNFKHYKVLHGNNGPPSGSYGNFEASGLSSGYNNGELGGSSSVSEHNVGFGSGHNNAFAVGYIDDYDGNHSNSLSSAPTDTFNSGAIGRYNSAHNSDLGGYNGGNNENIKIIRVIHEYVRSNQGQNHGQNQVQNQDKNYGSKGVTAYKLIHDYGQINGGFLGYTYVASNGHSAGDQSIDEPSQIIKIIHEKPSSFRRKPQLSITYPNYDQSNSFNKGASNSGYDSSVDPIKSLKSPGSFGSYNVPSTSYTSSQPHYLSPSQEYFPPATPGGYKYKK